jgi:hypothetical protein
VRLAKRHALPVVLALTEVRAPGAGARGAGPDVPHDDLFPSLLLPPRRTPPQRRPQRPARIRIAVPPADAAASASCGGYPVSTPDCPRASRHDAQPALLSRHVLATSRSGLVRHRRATDTRVRRPDL